MSIDMYLGSSDAQASSVSNVLTNRINAYGEIQSALNSFIVSHNLTGHAYESAKRYSGQVLIPLMKACILLDEAIIKACQKLTDDYKSKVDSSDLRESELVEKINRADELIRRYSNLIEQEYNREALNYIHIRNLTYAKNNHSNTKQKLEEKLQKLLAFNSQSSHLFTHIESLMVVVQNGLRQANSSWDASTQNFLIPGKDELTWVENVNEKWRQRFDISEAIIDYLIKPDFISKGVEAIHPHVKTAYIMGKNFMSAVSKDYTKSAFMKYGKWGNKTNEDLKTAWRNSKKFAKDKNWEWYKKLGSKWKKGSFNQFLNTVDHSLISKIANFKVLGKYSVKNISSMLGKITDPIKTYGIKLVEATSKSKLASKLKFLGKAAKKLGWVAVGVDSTITGVREYNNKNSRAYGSVGKSVIHAGVSQLKSAGPIEGAMIGSAIIGPWGAAAGFLAGTANTVLGIVAPQFKDSLYSGLQNKLDDGYDFVKNSLGKAVKGTWDTMTNWFGGGLKYAS